MGPGRGRMFEASAEIAPTAKPGPAPNAIAADEHDRGDRLDVGDRREGVASERGAAPRASRPAATSLAEGRERSYHQNAIPQREPMTSAKDASCQLIAAPEAPHGSARAWSGRGGRPALRAPRIAAPCSGSRAPPAPSRMRAVSVAKYQPPQSTSRRRPSAITRPSASRTRPLGELGGELDVVGGHEHRGARRPRRSRSHAARRRLAPRSMPRVGSSSASTAAGCSPPSTIASARRWRSSARQVARVASAQLGRGRRARARVRSASSLDALVQEVVAGVLQQQRHAPAPLDAPARRREQAGGVAQQRRLAGPVASHQHDTLAGTQRELDAAQDRRAVAQLVPDAAQRSAGESFARPVIAATTAGATGRRRRRAHRRPAFARLADGSSRSRRAQGGPRLLDAGRRGLEAGSWANSAPPGVCSGPARACGPLQEAGRVAVAYHAVRPRATMTRSAAARQRSRRCSISRTAVSDSWLRRRSCQISSSPATGSSCEVGSSSSTSPGRGARAAASATRCSSPPESSAVERSSRRRCRARARSPRRRARPRRGGRPAVLERQSELGADGAHDDLGLGVLQDRARERADRRGAVLAGVEAGDRDAPGEVAAVEVRHEPAAARRSVDLPEPERPASTTELAGLDRQRDIA